MKRLLKLGGFARGLLLALCLCVSVADSIFASDRSASGGPSADVLCSEPRGGRACAFAPRVRAALEKLDLGCRRWTILILDDEEWKRMVAAHAGAGRTLLTERAFTLPASRRTYLRESAFPGVRQSPFAGEPEMVLVEILAHEFAHLRVCGADEGCTREFGARIVRLVATEEKP